MRRAYKLLDREYLDGSAGCKPSMVLVLVMIAMLVSFPSLHKVQGCFISNCPVGGKKRESLEPQLEDNDNSCHGLCFMEGLCCAEGNRERIRNDIQSDQTSQNQFSSSTLITQPQHD